MLRRKRTRVPRRRRVIQPPKSREPRLSRTVAPKLRARRVTRRPPGVPMWLYKKVGRGEAKATDITRYEILMGDIKAGRKTALDITRFERELESRGRR